MAFILISGSSPSDEITEVAQNIKEMEDAGYVSFRSFGV
jgi:TRAP-type C4-dicarboxylate transport system permease large subunit